MRISLSSIGKFHYFDLARELLKRDLLHRLYSSYPLWKIRREGIPDERLCTFPWFHTPYMAQVRLPPRWRIGHRLLSRMARVAHDRHAARNMEPCDVFVALSGHNLFAGRRARELGGRWLCDRASTHIKHQYQVLRDEYARWGLPFSQFDPRVIEQEQIEYAEADAITVPSKAVQRTFIAQGISAERIHRIPYGVDLGRFFPVGAPVKGRFDIVFIGSVGLHKGVPYLLEAYRQFRHPAKSLTLIGAVMEPFVPLLEKLLTPGVRVLGPQPSHVIQETLSRSHSFVLPSIDEGFGLVIAEAMACGCSVICSDAVGGADLVDDGRDGFVVKSKNPEAIISKWEMLACDESLRSDLSRAALTKVRSLGGWSRYGDEMAALCARLANQTRP